MRGWGIAAGNFLACVFGYFSISTRVREESSPLAILEPLPKVEIQTEENLSPAPPEKVETLKLRPVEDASAELQELEKQFNEAAQELAQLLESSGVDIDETMKQAYESPTDQFFEQLPESLKPAFEKLRSLAERIQDLQLAQDGMDRPFFEPPSFEMPEDIAEKREELQNVQLPPEVFEFVQARADATEISNEDVYELVRLCDGEKSCIESSTVQWMDRNHLLSDEQFKILEPYL